MGDGRRLRAWVLAIAVAMIGSQILAYQGTVDLNESVYLTTSLGWLGAILGGLVFGFGMVLTGGCPSRTLVRLGAGNLKSVVVVLVLGVVAFMTMRGLIAPARIAFEDAFNLDLAARGLKSQNVGEMAAAALRNRPGLGASGGGNHRHRGSAGLLLQGRIVSPQPAQPDRRHRHRPHRGRWVGGDRRARARRLRAGSAGFGDPHRSDGRRAHLSNDLHRCHHQLRCCCGGGDHRRQLRERGRAAATSASKASSTGTISSVTSPAQR